MPWHEFIDTAVGPTVDDAGQHLGEVALGVDTVELAGLHQQGHGRPVGPAIVTGGEQGILPAKANGVDVALDSVGVEEAHEPAVVVQSVADRRLPPGRRASCAGNQANRSSTRGRLRSCRAAWPLIDAEVIGELRLWVIRHNEVGRGPKTRLGSGS